MPVMSGLGCVNRLRSLGRDDLVCGVTAKYVSCLRWPSRLGADPFRFLWLLNSLLCLAPALTIAPTPPTGHLPSVLPPLTVLVGRCFASFSLCAITELTLRSAVISDQQDYIEQGATAVLTKPVLEVDLRRYLIMADRRRSERQHGSSGAKPTGPIFPPPVLLRTREDE